MIERIRRGIFDLMDAVSARRRRGQKKPRRTPQSGALRGNMRNVIVVRPAEGIFTEAVFILRDDYFTQSGISRAALMRQAREAAEEYTRTALPESAGGETLIARLTLIILAAAAAAAALWLTGVLP